MQNLESACVCDHAAKCFAWMHKLPAAPFSCYWLHIFLPLPSPFLLLPPCFMLLLPRILLLPPCCHPRRPHRSRHVSSSPTPGSTAATAPLPVLPASAWQLGAVESETAGIEGSGAGSSSGTGAAGQEDDVPPLDLALLCGRAILPGNLALLLQEGEPRR